MGIAENNQVGGCAGAGRGMPGSAPAKEDEGEQNCDDQRRDRPTAWQ
jgi:hypothetical protein